jgi:hypothetical protein
MNGFLPALKWVFLGLACAALSSCAGGTAGERIADMPQWMGGEPADVPPRRGTPQYDSWMAARAQEAARPKTNSDKTNSNKVDPNKADQSNRTDPPK